MSHEMYEVHMVPVYVFQLLVAMMCVYIVDKKRPNMPEKARWWYLHTVINAGVVITALYDTLTCFRHPSLCFSQYWSNSWPCMITYAGHFYHVIFFLKDIKFIDWVHHILMVFVMIPVALIYQPYLGSNYANFFLSGLPGGLDYLILTLVICGKVDKMVEKSWNVMIQVWLRMPSLVLGCGFWWSAFAEEKLHWATVITGVLTLWNAVYFMHDTIANFYTKHGDKVMRFSLYQKQIEKVDELSKDIEVKVKKTD